ncbi:MAG: Rne/Rng family ribonuclease [Bacillota bacterium]
MGKQLVANCGSRETRVALLEDGLLMEMMVERPVSQRVSGNIYKGRVENVLPGMQAAFVNIGLARNAFLYVGDAQANYPGEDGEGGSAPQLSISQVVHPGQELIVQVSKDPMGTKGARVTTHITLPGRNLVLMPTVDYIGVSRRIDNEIERERLRVAASRAKPEGMGLIVRTVAEGASEEDLADDIRFLMPLWEKVRERAGRMSAPGLVYRDLELLERVVRDLFSEEIDQLLIDNRMEYQRIRELVQGVAPHLVERVAYHAGPTPIFSHLGIEDELGKALKRKVWLKCGGYLVFDQTEALTVIDVNTGKYVGGANLAETVFRTNLDAVGEIARQLRLRDIGGIIIIDFIDMNDEDDRLKLLEALGEAVRRDRTKCIILGLTRLGLVEMTRKKIRQSLDEMLQRPCPCCEGRGKVLAAETIAASIERELKQTLQTNHADAMLVEVHPDVAAVLIGSGGSNLQQFEEDTGRRVFLKGSHQLSLEDYRIAYVGNEDQAAQLAVPVNVGQQLRLRVEEPHAANPNDGIARIDGYIIDIAGGGTAVGRDVDLVVEKAFRTYAKARLV